MKLRDRPSRLIQSLTIVAGVMIAGSLLTGCGDDGDDQGATTTVTSTPSSAVTTTTAATTSSSSTTTSTTAPGTFPVLVWFSSGDGSDCGEVAPVTRDIGSDVDPIRAAFDALVAGPTAEEEAAGVGSFFSAETAGTIEEVTLAGDGLLTVDFADIRPVIPNASTSCGSLALTAQLNATAFQFADVQRARYRIQGSCDEFANFLQTECFDSDRSGAQLRVPTNERASGSGCTPPSTDALPDGRWYGLVDEAGEGQVAFDLACWFSGTAAVVASAEDGEESPPPNDYYVRNVNDLLRTVSVDPAAPVTWYPGGGDPNDVVKVAYDEWRVDRAARGFQFGVWLVVEDEVITAIEEQWVP